MESKFWKKTLTYPFRYGTEIVKKMEGDIKVFRRRRKGTIFIFLYPCGLGEGSTNKIFAL